MTNLRNTLLVLPPEQRRPGDPTRVLSLEEKTFGLAILESEDFAVTTDVELALCFKKDLVSACPISDPFSFYLPISLVAVEVSPRGCMEAIWKWQRTLPGYIFWPLKVSS